MTPIREYFSWRAAVLALCVALLLGACSGDGSGSGGEVGETIAFDRGIVATDAWAGQWHVVTTFSDCASGETRVVEDVVDWICPGDTIRFEGAALADQCTGTATDAAIHAACDYTVDDGDCRVSVSFGLDLERDGEVISGSGTWSASISPGCDSRYPVGCEHVAVEATRLDRDTGACDSLRAAGARPGLMERFGWRPRIQ